MFAPVFLLSAFVLSSPEPLPIAWGTATSAYQIEGGWNADGKGPSVWDTWYNDPSRAGRPNANVANDHYNRMVEDIAYLGQLNAKIYRFSVNWARILPNCTGSPNPAGIAFYNNMINEIIKNGAIPMLTLFHWETPQACHDQYGSWTNTKIVDDFEYYADIVFQNFGDRLEYILTINEPTAFCGWGYRGNFWPPGANLGEEALYICNHNVNLAHGRVAKMAARKYPQYNLKFGMPLIVSYGVPFTDSAADLKASDDHNAAQTDMHFSPMLTGDYSDTIKTVVTQYSNGPLLPAFTDAEKEMMRGTIDFIALNYYSANYVSATQTSGFPTLGPTSGTPWQTIGLINWADKYYKKMPIMITECGVSVPNELNMNQAEATADTFRQQFFTDIVTNLSEAILTDGSNVTAFIAWSLFDNFEWNTYDQVFGLIGINRNGDLGRFVKNSATYLADYFSNAVSPFKLPSAVGADGSPASGSNPGTTGSARNSCLPVSSTLRFISFIVLLL